MFGYVKPLKPELKIKEYDAYRAVYCGLCHQMGRAFGPFARLALSYDFTFLCMLQYAVGVEEPRVKMARCCVNPMKKVPMCQPDEVLSFGADAAVIMIYYKLLDNIQDGGFFSRAGWSLLRPLAAAAHNSALKKRPVVDASVALAMERQRQVEQAKSISADAACEPTAAALEEILGGLAPEGAQKRVLSRMGYLLGRYIYLSDALDDLEKDARTGNYNPFLLRAAAREMDPAEAVQGGRASLLMTAGELEKTYHLLDVSRFGPVLDNIICQGLCAGVNDIMSKKELRR